MKILHVVPGLGDPTNGIAVAAKWIAAEQSKAKHEVEVVDTREFVSSSVRSSTSNLQPLSAYAEIWVHSMWLPMTLKACWKVLQARKASSTVRPSTSNLQPLLVRMPHGCLDPVKMRYHLWKKIFFIPAERWLMCHADRIVATEQQESEWIERFMRRGVQGLVRPTVQMLDLGSTVKYKPRVRLGNRKFLFVGRMHPLKGFDVLLAAIRSLKSEGVLPADFGLTVVGKDEKGMRSRFKVEAKEQGLPVRFLGEVDESVKRAEMSTADTLVLPTLSENFALVVKESLELGVPVITTDGAKIWQGHEGVTYLDGFVSADVATRTKLLKDAIVGMLGSCSSEMVRKAE